LPGTAVDVIDEAGAASQVQQGLLPEEVVEVQKRIRFIVERMEAAIAGREFEKARFYSNASARPATIRKRCAKNTVSTTPPAVNGRREDIQRAVSALAGMPIERIR